jgi:hypothetical protein
MIHSVKSEAKKILAPPRRRGRQSLSRARNYPPSLEKSLFLQLRSAR